VDPADFTQLITQPYKPGSSQKLNSHHGQGYIPDAEVEKNAKRFHILESFLHKNKIKHVMELTARQKEKLRELHGQHGFSSRSEFDGILADH